MTTHYRKIFTSDIRAIESILSRYIFIAGMITHFKIFNCLETVICFALRSVTHTVELEKSLIKVLQFPLKKTNLIDI